MQSSITVTEVSGYLERRAFLRLPWQIYKGDANWVPPLLLQVKQTLDTRKNPFYRRSSLKLFLARKSGRPAGRVAAIICPPHNEFHGEKVGFFGFFECIDDPGVAAALLSHAKDWLAAQGMEIFRGPSNPSTNHECGMLVDGFDSPPQVMMPYNPRYYPALLEQFGLKKVKDLYAYRLFSDKIDARFSRLAQRVASRANLQVRAVDLKHFDRDVALIREIYNKAWEKNWGFIPVDEEEFRHLAKEMKSILEPSLALIGFADGHPAAFSVTLPNINEALQKINGRLFPFGLIKLMREARKIRSCRNLLLGVVPEYRRLGVDILLYKRTIDAGLTLGYTWGELSWILEDNAEIQTIMQKIGSSIYKTYRFYEMPVLSGCQTS